MQVWLLLYLHALSDEKVWYTLREPDVFNQVAFKLKLLILTTANNIIISIWRMLPNDNIALLTHLRQHANGVNEYTC